MGMGTDEVQNKKKMPVLTFFRITLLDMTSLHPATRSRAATGQNRPVRFINQQQRI